jgi:RNA polymerase sigma-70 factor (ECF subfamily)
MAKHNQLLSSTSMKKRLSFQTTNWSLIEGLADGYGSKSEAALAELCQIYRAPLLAYAAALYPKDAEDLVQGFFERLIQREMLAGADPEKGSLRTFLLTCLKRYIANYYREQSTHKRGGNFAHVSLDAADNVAAASADPEAIYQRRWAQEVLEQAVCQLREDWTGSGKAGLFEELCPFLGFQRHEDEKQQDIAVRLGMSAGALKTAIYRIRREYRETLLSEIARTLKVRTKEEVMAELKELIGKV